MCYNYNTTDKDKTTNDKRKAKMNTLSKCAIFASIQLSAIAVAVSIYAVHETKRFEDISRSHEKLQGMKIAQLEKEAKHRMYYEFGKRMGSSEEQSNAELKKSNERFVKAIGGISIKTNSSANASKSLRGERVPVDARHDADE